MWWSNLSCFLLHYGHICLVMIDILRILAIFNGSVENYAVFALMFHRFYPASRTLFKVCRFFLRLMCFIYRISLWFERFRMGFVEIYGVLIEFIKFFYYFLITFAMLWSIFTDFFSVLDSLTGFSCELYHVYAYVL